jgi:hypothetical protein
MLPQRHPLRPDVYFLETGELPASNGIYSGEASIRAYAIIEPALKVYPHHATQLIAPVRSIQINRVLIMKTQIPLPQIIISCMHDETK